MDAPFSNRDLNRFWLRQLAESVLMIYNALSPEETGISDAAKVFADRFDALALRADSSTGAQEAALNSEAFQAAQDVRKFFIFVLKKVVAGTIQLDLKTMLVSSFISQTELYLDRLHAFMNGLKPQYDLIEEEVFWLNIFTNQSRYIADSIGNFQRRYRDKALELAHTLNQYWALSMELKNVIAQTGDPNIPIATEHHRDVYNVLRELYEFTTTITRLQRETRIPGSLSLTYLSRIRRILCFYLTSAAKAKKENLPDCNPYAARIGNY